MVRSVLVTGASGRLGQAVVGDLVGAGYKVAAVDRRVPPAGHVHGVPVAAAELLDPRVAPALVVGHDAVVHLAAFAGPDKGAGHDVFANNTQSTFQVLAAAAGAGLRNVVIASSVSAYGMSFAQHAFSPRYVPVDEDHPMLPQDSYALSRQVDELTAAMFWRAHAMTVVALRFHWIADREQIAARVALVANDPTFDRSAQELWGYIEIGDAARACRLALEAPDGYHVLNVAAPDSLSSEPTPALIAQHHPGTDIRSTMTTWASAWSSERARQVLGFAPAWSWRDHLRSSDAGATVTDIQEAGL